VAGVGEAGPRSTGDKSGYRDTPAKTPHSGTKAGVSSRNPSTSKDAGKPSPVKPTTVSHSGAKVASPLRSGLAGLSCPAVITLPDVQVTPNSPAAVFLSGANAQDQDGVCAQPPLPAAQTTLSAASPATLIANCHNVDDIVKVLEGLTGPDQQDYATAVVNLALLRFGGLDDIEPLAEAVKNKPRAAHHRGGEAPSLHDGLPKHQNL
jgi:hypothetical protein